MILRIIEGPSPSIMFLRRFYRQYYKKNPFLDNNYEYTYENINKNY